MIESFKQMAKDRYGLRKLEKGESLDHYYNSLEPFDKIIFAMQVQKITLKLHLEIVEGVKALDKLYNG